MEDVLHRVGEARGVADELVKVNGPVLAPLKLADEVVIHRTDHLVHSLGTNSSKAFAQSLQKFFSHWKFCILFVFSLKLSRQI